MGGVGCPESGPLIADRLKTMPLPQSPSAPSRVFTIDDLRGPAGRLEALLNTGRPESEPAAPYSALVCHPHPAGGGTMHNKVVYHAMKALNAAGLPVLRFNFRGVGLSEGKHDHGRGEQDDVRAALNWLTARASKNPSSSPASPSARSSASAPAAAIPASPASSALACLSAPPAATTPSISSRTAPSPSSSSPAATTSSRPPMRSRPSGTALPNPNAPS